MALNELKRISLFLLIAVFCSFAVSAAKPPVKYWIKFKDKNGNPFSIDEPSKFLTTRSLDRRVRYNLKIDATDLPVTPLYISKIASVPNVKVLYASRWMNGVVIMLDSIDLAASALAAIHNFDFVVSDTKVQKYRITTGFKADIPASAFARGNAAASGNSLSANSFGGSAAQIKQLHADCLHENGFRGQGMLIGVLDAGFAYVDNGPIFDSVRARGGIKGTRDFVSGGDYAYQGSTHGTMVFSCLAANAPGYIMGTAPMADYWLFRTEAPEENLSEEYNWIRGAEFADSVGCDVLTTSLGYTEFDDPAMDHSYQTLNGRTAPMSIAATMAARKGMIVLNAAGNERANPWHFIGVPADADSIITVGGIDSLAREAAFSSVGPTSDGRIKPDLVAIGAWSYVSIDQPKGFLAHGTSFATPILAGAVACYWQANRLKNNMKLIGEMKRNASNAASPNNTIGWGIPDLCPNLDFDFEVNVDRARKQLYVFVAEAIYSEIFLEVVELSGRRVFYSKVNSSEKNYLLDTAPLSDGIYIVKVKTSRGTKSKKIALGGL